MDSEVFCAIFVHGLCECLSCDVCVLICVRSLLAVFPEEIGQTETDWTNNRATCIWQKCCSTAGTDTRQKLFKRWVSFGVTLCSTSPSGPLSSNLVWPKCHLNSLRRSYSSGALWMSPADQNTAGSPPAALSPRWACLGQTSALDPYPKTFTAAQTNTCRTETGWGKTAWTHTGTDCESAQLYEGKTI